MACSDSLNQLLLLLWKSGKTLLRSKGWLITQCLITALIWAVIVASLEYLGVRRSSDGPFTYKDSDSIEPLTGTVFGCVGTCTEKIKTSLKQICKEPSIDQKDRFEVGGCQERNSTGNWAIYTLTIRDLDHSVIDLDSSWQCDPPTLTSNQFYNKVVWYQSCKPPVHFQQITKYSGKMDKLSIRYLHPLSFDSHYGSSASDWTLILIVYAFPIIFFCAQVALDVSQESNSLIKDYLLSVGMSRILYFSHHFIFNFLKTWIPVIGCSIILSVFYKSFGFGCYLFLIFSFGLAAWICIAMVIGCCIEKPGFAAFATVCVLVVLLILQTKIPIERTSALCLLLSLIPNFAITLAIDAKRESELRGVNIWFSEVSEAFPPGYFVMMLISDTLLYFFLAVFIDFMRTSFENPLSLLRGSRSINEESRKWLLENCEKSDQQSSADLVIEGVHKMYSSGLYAVRGIDMRMYKGQVTALLGHNGAGKSTTFSMISGMTVPTKGRIQIMEEESREGRQKLIGFCPQYNAIFPKLTVDEHLWFFARLKGVESTNGEAVLTALGMNDKGSSMPTQLSGGMKRKLCIAIAFAANSPIILLDEPTAGMDTGARRDFERLLLERKKEHTILLTTHYTDEAELLADRIFIMAKGKVFCSGSAQFLRKRFDSGFVLSFAVGNESETEKASDEMMTIVKEYVPDASLYKQRAKQFEFKLSTGDTTRFIEMFRKIESSSSTFGVQSYGLSLNKLEQVFLKVGELTGTVDRKEEVESALKELIQENDRRSYGPGKMISQLGNILLKRLYFDIAHLFSLLFNLFALFGLVYLMLNTYTSEAPRQSGEWKDMLTIGDSYRIAIDSSLHANFDQIKRISKSFGDRLTIVKTDSIPNWYTDNADSRPPVIGGLSRNGNDWTIHVHPRSELHLPILEAIAAMANNPSLKKVKFNYIKKNIVDPFMKMRREEENSGLKMIMFVFLLPAFCPMMFIRPVSFLIAERISNFGHQQRLTGIPQLVQISSSMLYDFFLFIIHFLVFIAACFAGNKEFTSTILKELCYIPLVAFMCGNLTIRLFSRLFATPAKGEIVTFFLLVITAVVSALANYWLEFQSVGKSPLGIVSPPVALSYMHYNPNPETRNIVKNVICSIVHFVIIIILFILFEFGLITKWKRRNEINANPVDSAVSLDESVVLRVNNVQKTYKGPNKSITYAVKGVSFGVHTHECFGVLGINGAGKTSLFEMLTGNALPNGGSATVGGVDCSTPATIGYCPQMDALMEELTGRQSLVVLAALHGYENPRSVADIVITCVGMQEHADRKSKRYSGGQRRKISVAASLLAQNSLIILDEPTAGIDPITRRDIWSVICALRESTNTAIVLTSHSMDEVEALVSNLIIMREGSIVVEGSPQLIKNKFGDHYNFNMVIENGAEVAQITAQVLSVFPYASLYDSASLRNIKYHITRHSSDVFSEIFQKASNVAREVNATDFSFTQATLEDAFMLAATVKLEDVNGQPAVVPSIDNNNNEPKMVEVTAIDEETGRGTDTATNTGKEV